MPTEPSLLAAVAAAPGDDLPRLVYADWLDEQGRQVRADFIRSQVELNRLEEWFRRFTSREERKANGPEYGKRLGFLRRRVKALLDDHHNEAVGFPDGWGEHFPSPHHTATVSRGFIAGLRVEPAQVRWLPELLPGLLGPPPAVTVCGVESYLAGFSWVDADRLDDPTGWEWVTALDTDGLYWHEFGHVGPFTAEQLTRLARLPFPRLTELFLRYWELTDDLAALLAERFNLPALRSLDLMFNRLTPVGVRALSGAAWWSGLEELELSCSPPVRDLVDVLTAAPNPGLRRLVVGNRHELSGRVGEPLLAALQAAYPNAAVRVV